MSEKKMTATTPEMPARAAWLASAVTWSAMLRTTPVSAREASSMLVSTVMPSVTGSSQPRSSAARADPRLAAAIMSMPPTVCMVSMSAPHRAVK